MSQAHWMVIPVMPRPCHEGHVDINPSPGKYEAEKSKVSTALAKLFLYQQQKPRVKMLVGEVLRCMVYSV